MATTSPSLRRLLAVTVPGLLVLAGTVRAGAPAGAAAAPAEGAEPSAGLFITVPNPIDSKAKNRIITMAGRFLQKADARARTIVFDFNPDGRAAGSSDYGPCQDLARYLLGLQNVTTVAFVHNDVTGHTVLPVFACKDIVMSAGARLGDGLRDQAGPLWEDQRKFYELVANGRGRCPAVVLKTVDKDMEVWAGTRQGAVWFIDHRLLREEAKSGFVLTGREPLLPAGAPGHYDAEAARRFGLLSLVKESRQEVAEAYRLSAKSLRGDPLEGRSPVAWRVEVSGPITGALRETLERRIRRAVARGANLLILQLECGGGDTQTALDLGEFLRTRTDDSGKEPVMTVAYVTERARDNAVFLALGCTEVAMDRNARLGGFERLVQERPQLRDAIGKSLEGLTREQGYPVLVARGLLDPALAVHRVRSKRGQLERRLVEGRELNEDRALPVNDQRWVDEGQVKAAGEWWQIGSKLAEELGIAQFVVDGAPREALPVIYAHYGLERDRVQSAGPDWLDDVGEFLRRPIVSVFLVMIGIIGLVLELKMPGVGLPGVVAALCFVLYFWAHQMAGNFVMLAALLFVLGLILVGLEVFVVPGFGITGISGILLMVVGLALATLVKKPETTQEWMDFGATLSTFGFSLVAAVLAALALGWYLPHIPWANRLVLVPPDEAAEMLPEESAGLAGHRADLLGAIGVAATPLRPAGKARFGDDFLDVIAEGSYVPDGTRVQVVEIEGNRIVVKEV